MSGTKPEHLAEECRDLWCVSRREIRWSSRSSIGRGCHTAWTFTPRRLHRTSTTETSCQTIPFSTDLSRRSLGAFMYHCGTAPVAAHIANGMYGALIVDPRSPRPAAKELVFVQSEFYMSADSGSDGAALMNREQFLRRLGFHVADKRWIGFGKSRHKSKSCPQFVTINSPVALNRRH